MRWGEAKHSPDLTEGFQAAARQDVAPSKASPRREMSPFALRLTREERDRLSAKMCLGHPIFGNNTNSCARTDLFLSHGRNPGICRITCKPSCA